MSNSRPEYKEIPEDDDMKASENSIMNAFYNRYNGKGPMSVPGNQAYLYHNKIHRTGISQDKQITPQRSEGSSHSSSSLTNSKNKKEILPYKRYDSPERNEETEGSITDSSSVAGMALQDRHRGKPPTIRNKSPKHSWLSNNGNDLEFDDSMNSINGPGISKKQWSSLSDRPTKKESDQKLPIWNHFFNSGFYNGNEQRDEHKYSVSYLLPFI